MKVPEGYRIVENRPGNYQAQRLYITRVFKRERWSTLGHSTMIDVMCWFEDDFSTPRKALRRIDEDIQHRIEGEIAANHKLRVITEVR